MTLAITLLIFSPVIVGVCAAIWADERYDVLDRMSARSQFVARIRNLIDEP